MDSEDSFIKLFAGRDVKIEFISPNHIEFRAVHAERTEDELVSYEQMSKDDLLVVCAKKGVKGVDRRSSIANIIAALRTENADNDS